MDTLTLGDFINDDSFHSGQATLDVKRLMELSADDFVSAFRNEMRNYVKNHGHSPRCSRCPGKVDAEDIIRYFGENLHSACFISAYFQEREKLDEREREYFDRVVKLIAS
jgi:hypothetical protein